MNRIDKKSTEEAKKDLPNLLNEISFSYQVIYSEQQSLEDLDTSIQELSELVKQLKEENS